MDEIAEVLDFWFPDAFHDPPERHGANWAFRMRGGADAAIVERYAGLTAAAVAGAHDGWAATPFGRLALIVVLDQFPRSLWRDDPRAFAQDERALALTLAGYENGHYDALPAPWYRTVYNLPLGHCEGPDHLARADLAVELAAAILAAAPAHLKPAYAFAAEQARLGRQVIATYGRHPHRNPVLGRASTAEEAAYIAKGEFPHLRERPRP